MPARPSGRSASCAGAASRCRRRSRPSSPRAACPCLPDDPRLARTENVVIAAPIQSLEAAAEIARRAGVTPVILGDAIEGEAREVAAEHVAEALRRQAARTPGRAAHRAAERRRGHGDGFRQRRRRAERRIRARRRTGAGRPARHPPHRLRHGRCRRRRRNRRRAIGPDTLARARAAGRDPAAALAEHDSHGFFAALGDGVVTGPTLTNVNDFRAILIA